MVFKTVTMSELKRTGAAPLSAKDSHKEKIGKGNYNRFDVLEQRNRTFSTGKRRLPTDDSSSDMVSKAPKLDSNALFTQMREHEGKLKDAKAALDDIKTTHEDLLLSSEGGTGKCLNQMLLVLGLLLSHQEGLSSAVIDCFNSSIQGKKESPPPNKDPLKGNAPAGKKVPTPEELQAKRVRQAIYKAEKSTTIFDLDMGNVPIINKETLARKVTIALHSKAAKCEQVGEGIISEADAEEMVDDLLTCTSLDFLGNGSSRYKNERNPADPRIGKMCTLPVKMLFKGRDERILAEQTLRKVCQARCSTPYPKNLRIMIRKLVDEGKQAKPGHFVRVRVLPDSLRLEAHASIDRQWVDLKISKEIPLDILDSSEISEVEAEGEMETNIS
jgi:hypothetical protein